MTSVENAREEIFSLPEGLLDYQGDDNGILDEARAEQIVPRVVEYLEQLPAADRHRALDHIMNTLESTGFTAVNGIKYSQRMYKKLVSMLVERMS